MKFVPTLQGSDTTINPDGAAEIVSEDIWAAIIANVADFLSSIFKSSGKSDGGSNNENNSNDNKNFNITDKIKSQMEDRGWTDESINNTINDAYALRDSVNKETRNSATAYFNKDGSYVVVDNLTNDVIQISDTTRPWIPDSSIQDPYIP